MLAPHAVSEEIVLHAPDRAGLFRLVAADPEGGIILPYRGGVMPPAGQVISLRVVDASYGGVRVIARNLEPISVAGDSAPHFAVQWVGITTTTHGAYLAKLLAVLGIRAHLQEGGAVPDGRELVFDPTTQQAKMIALQDGLDRRPTAYIAEGRPAPMTQTQPTFLVETRRTPTSRLRTPPGNKTAVGQPAAKPSPRKTGKPIHMLLGRPMANDPNRPMSSYRVSARSNEALRVDHVDLGGPRQARRGPPAERRPQATPPRRPETPPPMSLGGTSRPPEFERPPAHAELRVGRYSLAVHCVALGQRSLSVLVTQGNLTLGTELHIAVPGDPLYSGYVWAQGVVDHLAVDPEQGRRFSIRLTHAPKEYRRLVQHWSMRQR